LEERKVFWPIQLWVTTYVDNKPTIKEKRDENENQHQGRQSGLGHLEIRLGRAQGAWLI